ncbi:MAG: hypothetical protein ABH886_08035 [Candidatus Desantisbacteria bacterium]
MWFDVYSLLRLNFVLARPIIHRPFNYEVISKAMPDYYSRIRPRIDEICDDIANLREKKDIGNYNNLMDEAERYEKILNELLGEKRG